MRLFLILVMHHRSFKLMAIGLLVALAIAAPVNASQGCGRIHGQTRYEKGGWGGVFPLPFTWVTTGTKGDLSDFYGYYSINCLPFGQYTLTASRLGFQTETKIINVTPEYPIREVNFRMQATETIELGLETVHIQPWA